MVYAAALIAGAAGLWLCLSPAPFASYWLIGGAAAIIALLLLAWRMKLIDREGAPYLAAPGLALFSLSRLGAALAANLDFARIAGGFSLAIRPALVRLKTRRGDDFARAVFVGSIAAGPGLATLDCDEDSILVHALVEDDGDEAEMRAIEAGIWRALGKGKEGTP